MSRVSTGKHKARLLAMLSTLDNGNFDVDQLAAQFDVKPGTILLDFRLLRSFGFVDVFPIAEEGACEMCSKQGKRVTHHWTDQFGFHTKSLCMSCNSRLGHMFKGSYPVWEEQVKALDDHTKGLLVQSEQHQNVGRPKML